MSANYLNGNMQFADANLISVLQHAAHHYGKQEVVTNSVEGGIHTTNYENIYSRSCQLANALKKLGVEPGDRIGTMGWNTWRHLECWYAISGIQSICHTLNPRLFPKQLEFIANHAQDKIIFVDISFVKVIAGVIDKLSFLHTLVVMTDEANMPDLVHAGVEVLCYETLLAQQSNDIEWPAFSETSASSLCYTSGTTGDPKGVLYSHRSNILHALAAASSEVFNLTSTSCVLMVVPMFHANSWGLAYSAPMTGAKLVMPGPHMDGASIHRLILEHQITTSAAVPTVWTGLLHYLESNNQDIPSLKETIIGGSAVPRSMFETFRDKYNVDVIHAWGMTETSPVGTVNRATSMHANMDTEALTALRLKQGRAVFGVSIEIFDDNNEPVSHDGIQIGRLCVKGPWVIERYYEAEDSALDEKGWLDTGDIATIDKDGFMQITDRSKDLIKSGGEWISSVDIENTAVGHPDIDIAACIGIYHPKWEERPLLLAVKKKHSNPTADNILSFIGSKHATWQIPDQVLFVDQIPLTATGKVDKKQLRLTYMDTYRNLS